MTIFPAHPCSCRCCLLRVSEQLLMAQFCCQENSSKLSCCYLEFSSPLPRSLCSSPIPSTDLQPPPTPLQTSSRGRVFIMVFIIALLSFTAGSQLHLKENKIKNQNKTVRGSTMTPELQESRVPSQRKELVLEVGG